jgi:hypothetical protein
MLTDQFTAQSTASLTGKTIAVPRDILVNSLVVVAACANGADTWTSGADSSGNSWAKRLTSVTSNNAIHVIVQVAKVATQIDAGDTITVNYSLAKTGFAAVVGVFDDLVSSTALDGADADDTNTSTSPAAGPTGDPAASRVLALFAVGARGQAGSAFTAGSSFTRVEEERSGSSTGATDRFCALAYRYVDSPGAISASGSITSDNWTATLGCIAVPALTQPFVGWGQPL